MDESCALCNVIIVSNDEHIGCYGLCGRKYHLSCLSSSNKNYKKSIVSLLLQVPNLYWYCNDCLTYTLEGALGGLMRKLRECSATAERIANPLQQLNQLAGNVNVTDSNANANATQVIYPSHQQQSHQIPNNTHQATLATLVTEPMDDLHGVRENGALSQMVIDSPSEHFASRDQRSNTLSNLNDQNGTLNRKRSLSEPSSPKRRKTTENLSHKTLPLSQMVVLSENFSNRSIYVTKFKPITSTEQIIGHLRSVDRTRRLADKIKCSKLISDRKNPNKLQFVSFKLDVPSEHFNSLIDPSIWPSGITAKEFLETQSTKLNKKRESTSGGGKANKSSKMPKRSVNVPKRSGNVPKNPKLPTQSGQRKWAPPTQMENFNPMSIFPMANYPLMPFQPIQPQPRFIPNAMQFSMYPPHQNYHA